jgi:phosphoribosylamine--glycine ligase
MKVLVLGQGGREHALCWKISQSPLVEDVFVYPGNPGILKNNRVRKLEGRALEGSLSDFVISQVRTLAIDLVVVGPENYLADGLVDDLSAAGILAVGPDQSGAQVEASKAYSKNLMKEAGIPTAGYENLSGVESVANFIERWPWEKGMVIKRDGLAAGKGVFVCPDRKAASEAYQYLKENQPEDSYVVEELLTGKEVSFFFLCCGTKSQYLGHACDYKRLQDGDKGPNTGGMGTYSPAPWLDLKIENSVQELAIQPLLEKLQEKGKPFYGILFCGLMVDDEKLNVLEYNVRLGDPETQVLLPLLEDDLVPWLMALAKKDDRYFDNHSIKRKALSAVHVVKAAKGYPGLTAPVRKGDTISLGDYEQTSGQIFFAGVDEKAKELVTAGGRVLGVTAWAKDHESARTHAYELAKKVSFADEQMRSDIGKWKN